VPQEWERYWARINGNDTIVWGPDPDLTALGIEQAEAANAMWREHTKLGLPTPDVIYTSPFRRSIKTSIITFNRWFYPDGDEHGNEASKSVRRIVIEVS
jgi:bisphosphoglycerate-dependent phosphoglycerate mutase